MSNAQPAKLPKLEVDSLLCDGIIGLFPTMDEGEDLCIAKMVHPDWLTTEQVKERAQLIAEACNSYPELQAKLAELEKPCVWTWEGKFCCFTASCGAGVGPIPSDYVTTPFNFCPYCGHRIELGEDAEA